MAELFGEDVFNTLLTSVGDIMETFAKRSVSISYNASSNTISRFGEDHPKTESKTFNAVIVWPSGSSDSNTVAVNEVGKSDLSEGYCLIDYKLFEQEGLLNFEGDVHIQEGDVSIVVDGTDCEVLAFTCIGQAGNTYSLVKVQFKKKIPNA